VPGKNALPETTLFIFTLEKEARSSKTSVQFYQATLSPAPCTLQDGNRHGHCRKNLKYRKENIGWVSFLDGN
jgi:hypothetical protein